MERFELRKTGDIAFSHPQGTHDDVFWATALAVYAAAKSPGELTVAKGEKSSKKKVSKRKKKRKRRIQVATAAQQNWEFQKWSQLMEKLRHKKLICQLLGWCGV